MPTEPWAAYPPEMNAARILGTGTASLAIAAATWAVKSAQTATGQGVFMAQNANQAANIYGAVSDAVSTTAVPFGTWLNDFVAESARNAVESANWAQAHMAALVAMVPLPVIIANRVASAAGHAASAAGAVNPVGISADAAYAGFQVQNAAAMTAYDAVTTGNTLPRVYAPPPPLVTGNAASGIASGEDVVSAAQRGLGSQQNNAVIDGAITQARATLDDPTAMAGLQNTASSVGPYAASPAAANPAVMQQTAMAMSPASMVAGQMSAPKGPGGVTYSGLGSGSQAMSPSRNVSGGGLPLLSAASGARSLAGLSSLLGGTGSGGSLAGPASVARPFTGVPTGLSGGITSGAGTGHSPMGAMPHAAGGTRDGKRNTFQVKEVESEDPVAVQQATARALAQFR